MKRKQEYEPKWVIWMRPRRRSKQGIMGTQHYGFPTKKARDLAFEELVKADKNDELEIIKNVTALPYEKKK